MSFDQRQHMFTNNASGRLLNEINPLQTTITLGAGEGDRFPSPGLNQIFKVTVMDYTTGDREIMHCTARSGDVLTVERGREDTVAHAFVAQTLVQLRITAETLHYLQWLLEEDS